MAVTKIVHQGYIRLSNGGIFVINPGGKITNDELKSIIEFHKISEKEIRYLEPLIED